MMDAWIATLLQFLTLPQNSLGTVFVVALLSATLLPMGSEPVVFGLIQLRPDGFWPIIAAATLGNTLGGAITWWMGFAASGVAHRYGHSGTHLRALEWLRRIGPAACLLSWLPLVGDPLCAVAGWLKLPFWPCVLAMLVGKCLRYIVITASLGVLVRWWG